MDTIESLSKQILEMEHIISRNDTPDQLIDKYKLEIILYEAKKAFLINFGV